MTVKVEKIGSAHKRDIGASLVEASMEKFAQARKTGKKIDYLRAEAIRDILQPVCNFIQKHEGEGESEAVAVVMEMFISAISMDIINNIRTVGMEQVADTTARLIADGIRESVQAGIAKRREMDASKI